LSPARFSVLIGLLAVLAGILILLRDLIQIHSVPYAIAGVGMLAFGAWRLQAARGLR
jgi:hypothetical protein